MVWTLTPTQLHAKHGRDVYSVCLQHSNQTPVMRRHFQASLLCPSPIVASRPSFRALRKLQFRPTPPVHPLLSSSALQLLHPVLTPPLHSSLLAITPPFPSSTLSSATTVTNCLSLYPRESLVSTTPRPPCRLRLWWWWDSRRWPRLR